MVSGKFLHARSIDELILDCYRLGKFYSVDPSVFLGMTITEVTRHIYWTDKLTERMIIESSAAVNDG